MIRLIATLIASALLLVSQQALAFHEVGNWNAAPESATPGGGRLFSTGSTRDYGFNCGHCHTKAPGTINLTIAPAGNWPQKNGSNAYLPGTTYVVVVNLIGENKGLVVKPNTTNYNSFMATFETQSGAAAGSIFNDSSPPVSTANCATQNPGATSTTLLMGPMGGQCQHVFSRPVGDKTQWTFSWIAPPAGTGAVTIYWGAVDGDRSDTSNGDDVRVGTVRLIEGP